MLVWVPHIRFSCLRVIWSCSLSHLPLWPPVPLCKQRKEDRTEKEVAKDSRSHRKWLHDRQVQTKPEDINRRAKSRAWRSALVFHCAFCKVKCLTSQHTSLSNSRSSASVCWHFLSSSWGLLDPFRVFQSGRWAKKDQMQRTLGSRKGHWEAAKDTGKP